MHTSVLLIGFCLLLAMSKMKAASSSSSPWQHRDNSVHFSYVYPSLLVNLGMTLRSCTHVFLRRIAVSLDQQGCYEHLTTHVQPWKPWYPKTSFADLNPGECCS